MNLDDLSHFQALDAEHMLGHIDALPEHIAQAWALAQDFPLPDAADLRHIVITGMGGSAIGGDYLAALLEDTAPIPVAVNRGYTLPAYAAGPETLVIASSFSGGTEETLSAFAQAVERGCTLMAITTGGQLAARAAEAGAVVWQFDYQSQPRAAFGWSLGLLLGLAHRLGLAAGLADDVQESLDMLRRYRELNKAETPVHKNPAKKLAGQFVGRIGVFYGAGILAPVARRWKAQLNENAKAWAEFDVLPEMNHNAIAGTEFPRKAIEKLFCVFLQSGYDHPRVARRHALSFKFYLEEGIGVDRVKAKGGSRLAQMLFLTQLGDYLSFYLAMANAVDPTPIPQIALLKQRLDEEA